MFFILLELGVLGLMVLLNGALVMVEVAVVSSDRSRLREWSRAGDRRARAALELAESPAGILSVVRIGVTLGCVFIGAFGGVTLAGEIGRGLARIPLLGLVAGPVSVIGVVVAIALVVVIFGTLVPRRIALSRPEEIARAVARPVQKIADVAVPVAQALGAASDSLAGLLRLRPKADAEVDEEESAVERESDGS